jgi:hypothetical protein
MNYPMHWINVILVDDESKKSFKFKVSVSIRIIGNIRLTNSPKKDAIVTAMNVINTDWVITTDADCVVSAN